MELDMLRADGHEDLLMGMQKEIRAEYPACFEGQEHIGIPRTLRIFLYHKIHEFTNDRTHFSSTYLRTAFSRITIAPPIIRQPGQL